MRRIIVALIATGLLVSMAPMGRSMPPEGCAAYNPGEPVCRFEVTHNTAGPVSGVAGRGSWAVVVKRGKKRIVLKSPPSGEPYSEEFLFKKGDKVTARARSAGSSLIVGGE
jgi:hypothetical protein